LNKYLDNKITDVYIEQINIKEKFIDFAERFADTYGACALISGGNDKDCARYDILGIKPWLTFKSKGKKIEISVNKSKKKITADPFEALKQIYNSFETENRFNLPLTCGLIGYFAYDLKNLIEDLPETCLDTNNLPDILLFAHLILLIFDKKEQKTFLCIPEFQNNKPDYINKIKEEFYQDIEKPIIKAKYFTGVKNNLKSGFTKKFYINSINQIKEYIKAGDIYQANMTQRFETDFDGRPYTLFKKLYKKNPAPFFAYINGENHYIVSTSPERFIKRDGEAIETRPIKGTKPRKKNKIEDQLMANQLCQSKKDDAELSMIVDLLRNDIGKVCKSGSVKVTAHKRLETYDNVFHLVSDIKGELDPKKNSIDLIKAVFPGGSITGCPKIRAMEIIDELEPVRRHIYTGSIGYVSFHDTLDLSIAIRTATICDKKIYFSVGGGIVYDSVPKDEYDETLYKGKTFFNILKKNTSSKPNTRFVWINGKMEPENQTFISVTDKGFLYGYGFFETIKAKQGKPLHLKEHIQRFNKTWTNFFTKKMPAINWLAVIKQTLKANLLLNRDAAIKIIASEKNLIVSAKKYTSRIENKKEPALKLLTYPHPRQTPLADYKTLNYLYYYLAGQWAKKNGADEAIILNPDLSVSETNTANIIALYDKKAIMPKSLHVLPGITEQIILKKLKNLGYTIETKKIYTEDLLKADAIILTNSLIEILPVLSVNKTKIKYNHDLCQTILKADIRS